MHNSAVSIWIYFHQVKIYSSRIIWETSEFIILKKLCTTCKKPAKYINLSAYIPSTGNDRVKVESNTPMYKADHTIHTIYGILQNVTLAILSPGYIVRPGFIIRVDRYFVICTVCWSQ